MLLLLNHQTAGMKTVTYSWPASTVRTIESWPPYGDGLSLGTLTVVWNVHQASASDTKHLTLKRLVAKDLRYFSRCWTSSYPRGICHDWILSSYHIGRHQFLQPQHQHQVHQRHSRGHTLHSWPEKTDWTLTSISKQTIEHLERQDFRWHRLVRHSLTSLGPIPSTSINAMIYVATTSRLARTQHISSDRSAITQCTDQVRCPGPTRPNSIGKRQGKSQQPRPFHQPSSTTLPPTSPSIQPLPG